MENNTIFREIGSTCPFCGNPVCIIEGMVYEYTLNEYNGCPDNLLSEEYKVAGYCPNCHNQVFVVPEHGRYKVYPFPVMDNIDKYNRILGKEDEPTRISLLGDDYMTDIDNNPFTNVVNTLTEDREKLIEELASENIELTFF